MLLYDGVPPAGAAAPAVHFHRVIQTTYLVSEGTIEGMVKGPKRDWVVAVNARTGRALVFDRKSYRVSFNELVSWIPLRVASPERAVHLFEVFMFIADGSDLYKRIVLSEMDLEAMALVDFSRRFPSGTARREFQRWWEVTQKRYGGDPLEPTATARSGQFDVRCFVYEAGELEAWICSLRSDGHVDGWRKSVQ